VLFFRFRNGAGGGRVVVNEVVGVHLAALESSSVIALSREIQVSVIRLCGWQR